MIIHKPRFCIFLVYVIIISVKVHGAKTTLLFFLSLLYVYLSFLFFFLIIHRIKHREFTLWTLYFWFGCLMVFNVTFNNISVISWRSVLLVEETGRPGENHRPVASH
jgi:hypothetical protein